LRLLARVPAGAEEARAALERGTAGHQVPVRIVTQRLVEDVGLDGARDDVDGRGYPALPPVGPQALAQDDQAVALVLDAREELLERALQRQVDARLEDVALRELLREEHVVGRDEMRSIYAQKRHTLHLPQPDSELEEERRRLGEADVEIPAIRIEDPRRQ